MNPAVRIFRSRRAGLILGLGLPLAFLLVREGAGDGTPPPAP